MAGRLGLCRLLPDSPAIDFGGSAGLPATDQRGYLRPFGDGPDMGAYEFGSVLIHGSKSLDLLRRQQNRFRSRAFPGSTLSTPMVHELDGLDPLSTNGPFAVSTNITQTISQPGTSRGFFRLFCTVGESPAGKCVAVALTSNRNEA